MREVPQRVHARDLVDEELDKQHETGSGENERMREHAQMNRQIEPIEVAQRPDDEEHRVESNSACPAECGGESDQLPGVEVFHDLVPLARSPTRRAVPKPPCVW